MDTKDAIKTMANNAGRSVRSVSLALGYRNDSIGSTLARGSIPKTDTLAAIAEVCGYELALIPKGLTPDSAIKITKGD